ncbi:polyprenyl synthetase family protein [Methanolobus profundi]|uniref:Farnesyl-diphosphate synthase /geranylgeranyl-diphosphate synthase n=1 Tax=Methanolobus profundi TaxID=487685 RepID=A0A1I4S6M3_9EURY|nr:polyprenyl synthetase family protein [Methanolobus profundi]SFM59920.1 farnesyl-diphosphate synthase /geranylgeranyl-diphosphate synthase [Methanolobus profundi]
MDLIEEIKKRSVHVDKGIEEYLPIDKPYELYKAARYLPDAGGKRLRPATVILAAEAVGSDLETALPAAVAVELVHNFTLVHDDIMDRDDIRRGMPAVHVKWGEAGAILAGDTLYSKAFEILTRAPGEPERNLKCIDILSKTCRDICEGQWMDVEFEDRTDVTKEEYLEMIEKKTGVLYAASMQIGAILGGASEEVSDAFYECGRLIGIAFQIYDDVIDMTTPEEVLGKVRGSDLMEGKKTLIAIHALNKGVELKIFGKGEATTEEINEAVKQLEDAGSIDYVRDLALSYIAKGKELLNVVEDSESKTILMAIADYMITRSY